MRRWISLLLLSGLVVSVGCTKVHPKHGQAQVSSVSEGFWTFAEDRTTASQEKSQLQPYRVHIYRQSDGRMVLDYCESGKAERHLKASTELNDRFDGDVPLADGNDATSDSLLITSVDQGELILNGSLVYVPLALKDIGSTFCPY
jgi:hypothetical protein